ncbi:MAG: hypothetical protein KIT87_26680 [Anaerolineae bacterium]|nr:hypothetical protein [Anaerolineae bacterium]
MEAIAAAVVGLGIVAVSPFVPGLRQVAKKTVVVGMAAASSTAALAATAGEQWKDLVNEAKAEREADQTAKVAATEPETITITAS